MARKAGSAVFASYNIHKCVGSDRRFDPRAGAGGDRRDRRRRDRAAGGGPALRRPGRAARPAGARARRPGWCRCRSPTTHRGHGWHGNLVLVREGAVRGLRQIALPGLEPRGALVADLDLAMGPVRVVAAHLGLLRHSRLLQVEALLAHAGEATDRPVVLMGDLNEWRRQRRSALTALRAGLRADRRACRAFPPYFPVLALDRVLARPQSWSSGRGARHAAGAARLRPPAGEGAGPAGRTLPGAARSHPSCRAPRRRRRCSRLREEGRRHERALRPRRASLALAGRRRARPGRWPSARPTPTTTAWSPRGGEAGVPRLSRCMFEKCDPNGDGLIDQGEFPLLDNFYWMIYVQR